MKKIVVSLLILIAYNISYSQIKEVPKDLFNNYWDCDYAIKNTLQPIEIMEICDLIVADVWKNYFLKNGEDMMVWHNSHKDFQNAIRKGMLRPDRKKI